MARIRVCESRDKGSIPFMRHVPSMQKLILISILTGVLLAYYVIIFKVMRRKMVASFTISNFIYQMSMFSLLLLLPNSVMVRVILRSGEMT